MQFLQNKKDGSCKIQFSWKERFILFFKGKLFLDPVHFKHFTNSLVKIAAEWQANFGKDTKNIITKPGDSIQGK